MNRSYPERYTVATVRQHGAECSGGFPVKPAKPNTPKGGQREPPGPGRKRAEARLEELPECRRCLNNTPLTCERKAT
jgi:hypothetical protein